MKSVKRLFQQMTKEDWEISKKTCFETMMNEIDDQLQKWVDMKNFGQANDKQIALIDATMATMYIAMQEGEELINKAKPRHRNGSART